MTPKRWLIVLALVVLGLGFVGVVNTATVRGWLYDATGEESTFEGLKGVVALALLSVNGPHPQLAPDAPLRDLASGPYGANVFLQLEADPENVRHSYQAMHDAGITWARQQFPWEDIEIHGRGDFEDRRNDPPRSAWDKYDNIVREAQTHSVELLVRLDDPPEWAYADVAKSGDKGPPDDLADYASFVSAVVKRYCGKVKYYQLWNEPNIYPEWGERDVDPAGYAALLKAGAAAARAACPGVVIVSAALAPNTEPGGKNMNDLQYLEGLYQSGWQPNFDVLAAQAFGLFTGPRDHRVSADRTNFGRMLLARDIMVKHGDAAKPVWITEMGWTSPPEEYPTKFGRVSEERRAEYTVQAYERIQREWPWIGPAFLWFLRRPDDIWERAPEGYGFFRILGPDWTETPTFQALRTAANAPPVLFGGRHALDSPGITFTGPWEAAKASDGSPLRVGATDAEVQLTFQGTGAEVLLDINAAAPPPKLTLVLDGETRSVEPETTDIGARLTMDRLPDAEHLAILRVDEGEAQLREVRVTAPAPASPLAPLGRLAGLAGAIILIVLLALVWRRRRRTQESPGAPPASVDGDALPAPDTP